MCAHHSAHLAAQDALHIAEAKRRKDAQTKEEEDKREEARQNAGERWALRLFGEPPEVEERPRDLAVAHARPHDALASPVRKARAPVRKAR